MLASEVANASDEAANASDQIPIAARHSESEVELLEDVGYDWLLLGGCWLRLATCWVFVGQIKCRISRWTFPEVTSFRLVP